jgi:DNA-binding SARP family transcriptional activator
MAEFQLRLFGGLQLSLDDKELTSQLSVKAQGLICYLAVTGRPQTRLKLAGLFWGDKPDAAALRSLRVELTKIRKHLAPYFAISRQAIAFKQTHTWLDCDSFAHQLKLAQGADNASARSHLREAVALYTGDFLDGYQAGDALGFEEWLFSQRERYRSTVFSALGRLVDYSLEMGDFEAGIEYANQLLLLDPWLEEGHRQLMWLYAQNGQRGAALRQYESCREVLAVELGVEPSPETTALWQQIQQMDGESGRRTQPLPSPKTAALQETPFQAPVEVPFFSGRQAEMADLAAKISGAAGGTVFCITGMGGVGKTSLVTQLAYALRDAFPDGVLWADGGSSRPESIAESWALAYGYDFTGIPDLRARLTAVREMLSQKRALVVLDDVTVAARVKPFIPADGDCVVLVTTRNGEVAAALRAELVNLDVLSAENGRALLAVIIGEERIYREESYADEICAWLQNLPLALAIAGQYLAPRPRRKLAEFAARLKVDSPLLDIGDSEGVVRASFDISWSALDQNQKRVFAVLAVFNGRSFTAEAIAYIAEQDSYEAQDYLDGLVSRSLLIEEGSFHYRQHTLLSIFAQEKLAGEQSPWLRMIAYFQTFVQTHQTDYAALGPEWDNFDAAIQTARDLAQWERLFALTHALHAPWFARGHFDRAQRAYQLAYEAALDLEDGRYTAESLHRQGQAALELGQLDQAKQRLLEALQQYRQLRDTQKTADVQYDLARIHIDQADYQEAVRLLAESLAVKEAAGDQSGVALLKYRTARLLYNQNKYELAQRAASEAAAVQESLGETLHLVRTLRLLVWINSYSEQYEEARRCGERALALAESLQDRGETAMAYYCLTEVSRRFGEFEQALAQVQKSLDLLEQMGDTHSVGRSLLLKAIVYLGMEQFENVFLFARQAYEKMAQVQDKLGIAWALGNMARGCFGLGDAEGARTHAQAAREVALGVGDEVWVAKMDDLLAEIARHRPMLKQRAK